VEGEGFRILDELLDLDPDIPDRFMLLGVAPGSEFKFKSPPD